MPRETSPQFSRSGETDFRGKCTKRIDIPVPEELEEQLIALAVMAKKPKAEYARMLLLKAVSGEFAYMQSVMQSASWGDGKNGG